MEIKKKKKKIKSGKRFQKDMEWSSFYTYEKNERAKLKTLFQILLLQKKPFSQVSRAEKHHERTLSLSRLPFNPKLSGLRSTNDDDDTFIFVRRHRLCSSASSDISLSFPDDCRSTNDDHTF